MSLRKQPEFEAETATTTKEETMTTTINDTAAASVAATTAIAKAATGTSVGAVAQPRMKFPAAYAELKDVFDMATVSAMSQAMPRITAEQGALKKNRMTSIGSKANVEVISWNTRLAIGCGEDKQNDEMKQLYRVSFDGVTVDGDGCSVESYLDSLRAQGYAKAKASPYIDLFGYITWSEKGGDIAPDDRELTLFQLSKTSAGNFTAFCVSRGLLESRGRVQRSDVIEVTAEDKTRGSKSFTNMSFKPVK